MMFETGKILRGTASGREWTGGDNFIKVVRLSEKDVYGLARNGRLYYISEHLGKFDTEIGDKHRMSQLLEKTDRFMPFAGYELGSVVELYKIKNFKDKDKTPVFIGNRGGKILICLVNDKDT